MPITYPNISTEVATAFARLKPEFSSMMRAAAVEMVGDQDRTNQMRRREPTSEALTMPVHEVHTVPLKSLVSSDWLKHTVPAAYRLNIAADGRAAVITQGEDNPTLEVTSRSTGIGLSEEIASVLKNRQDDTTEVVREMRLLSVPSIGLTAVWLHAQTDSEQADEVIPVGYAPGDLLRGAVYSPSKFVEALKKVVQRRQSATASNGEG